MAPSGVFDERVSFEWFRQGGNEKDVGASGRGWKWWRMRYASSAMPRKKRLTTTKVTAYLPYSVDLTKLKSGNTLDVQVRSGPELLGTLLLGRGSVQWWPRGNKTHALRKNWKQFAEILTRYMASASPR
jgi:hypothetical protein